LDHNPSLGRGGKRALAVDVAAGSGQASLPLASIFERVVALDSCAEQLAAAKKRLAAAKNNGTKEDLRARVEFLEADAHATGLPPGSADLVCVAQGLHWFDVPRFAAEAARILQPHGSLAAWSYGLASVAAVAGAGGGPRRGGGGADTDDDDEQERPAAPPPAASTPALSAGAGAADAADAAIRRFYESLLWDERRRHVDDGYARLLLELRGASAFGRVETKTLEMRSWRSVDELVGYVSSWSGTERLRAARREVAAAKAKAEEEHEEEDVVAVFRRELVQALGGVEEASLELVTPITLVLCCEPRPQKQ
jgi:SAM-dependent methyltransferase